MWIYTDHEMMLYSAYDIDKQYMKDRVRNDKYKHAKIQIFPSRANDVETSDNTVRGDRSVASDTTRLSASGDRD